MKVRFKTIYRCIYSKIVTRGDVTKLKIKGKSLKPKETIGKFNIDKNIKDKPKEIRKRG